MNRHRTRGLAAGLLGTAVAICATSAHAQADTGRVVGTVTDTTGGAVPGAVVTISNVDNGTVLKASSTDTGEFNVLAVPRGTYKASVTAPGFQTQEQTFILTVTQVQTLLFKLAPGAVSTTVEVTSDLPLVDTSTPTMGETIQGKQLTDLPLN
ncbi:MAG TPA: carboxypeptidase-like regulatory domain-containing protein, partial [Acidobacteriaceae bacterium]|nr:carboxypeptidase-like regulatory domain-containing protein [Acidobacteriaceae bacterium]